MYSTTLPPGRNRPSRSAAPIAAFAIRSFMEPVGLAPSSLTKTRLMPGMTTRRSWTNGVSPMLSRTSAAGGVNRGNTWATSMETYVSSPTTQTS